MLKGFARACRECGLRGALVFKVSLSMLPAACGVLKV